MHLTGIGDKPTLISEPFGTFFNGDGNPEKGAHLVDQFEQTGCVPNTSAHIEDLSGNTIHVLMNQVHGLHKVIDEEQIADLLS